MINNNLLCTIKKIVKYTILIGLIYCILKIIPSNKMSEKEMFLLMSTILIGCILVDKIYLSSNELFTINNSVETLENIDSLIEQREEQLQKFLEPQNEINENKQTETREQVKCDVEIEKTRQKLQNEINELKNYIYMKEKHIDENNIATRYLETLIKKLYRDGIITKEEIENIRIKLSSKLLTLDEVLTSLETLKKQGKVVVSEEHRNNIVKNDFIYNELPSDFYHPIGDKIANEWDDGNEFTILDTSKWKVPMPKPPICVTTTPCQVCPSDSSSNYATLKSWDNSRNISNVSINKKWASDKISS
jgi:hypothetical protein